MKTKKIRYLSCWQGKKNKVTTLDCVFALDEDDEVTFQIINSSEEKYSGCLNDRPCKEIQHTFYKYIGKSNEVDGYEISFGISLVDGSNRSTSTAVYCNEYLEIKLTARVEFNVVDNKIDHKIISLKTEKRYVNLLPYHARGRDDITFC